MADRCFQITFNHFHNLVLLLHMQWQMFRDLYFDSSHQEVFHDSAPVFFNHLNDHLLDLIVQSVSRFFDPAIQNGYENLSIKHILSYDEVSGISHVLETESKEMEAKWAKGIKIWRHKRLSHSDLRSYLAEDGVPDVPTRDVQEIVEGIGRFSNRVQNFVYQRDIKYEVYISHWVPDLIRCLKRGIEKSK